jgi:hypothetical protein
LHHASGKDIEGTAIYAGKRQKLLQLINSANKATNNARQIFAQVGITINESLMVVYN